MLTRRSLLWISLLTSGVGGCAADQDPPAVDDAATTDAASEEAADAEMDAMAEPADAGLPELDAEPLQPSSDASAPRDAEWLDASSFDAASADAACVADGGMPQLAAAVVGHACLHGSDGPFRVVNGGSTPENAPDVSRSHTLFTVLGSAGATLHVRYVPDASGDHVLFVGRGELLTARQGAMTVAHERADAACGVLPVMYVLPLPSSEPVELTLRAKEERVALVLESLAPWAEDAWTRPCGAPLAAADAGSCRKNGPCSSDSECCSFCHDYDHCH